VRPSRASRSAGGDRGADFEVAGVEVVGVRKKIARKIGKKIRKNQEKSGKKPGLLEDHGGITLPLAHAPS